MKLPSKSGLSRFESFKTHGIRVKTSSALLSLNVVRGHLRVLKHIEHMKLHYTSGLKVVRADM